MLRNNIQVPMTKIEEFCRKWNIIEFSLFGSVLREDFSPKSDIDVMVSFDDRATWDLLDLVVKPVVPSTVQVASSSLPSPTLKKRALGDDQGCFFSVS